MKNIILVTLLSILIACKGNVGGHHHHEGEEEHSHEATHEHNHDHSHGTEGHNHEDEDHDHEAVGHNHSHSHEAEGHNHEGTGHNHEAEEAEHNHGSSDEIVVEPEKAEVLGITTTKATMAPFSGILKVSGNIESDNSDSWNIVANRSGKVTFLKKNIEIGLWVKTYETLFKISSDGMNSENHQIDLAKYKAELTRAETQFNRISELKNDKLATNSEYIEAKKEYEIAKADYEKANLAINQKLSAPHEGYITSLNCENGQFVSEGSPIATISTGKEILIAAKVPARYSSSVKDITGANFVINGKVYDAGKKVSSSTIVTNGGTVVPVHFKAEKNDDFSVGMPVEVYIKLGADRNVISLPKSAIAEKYGKYFVYVKLDDECYKETEVTLGENDGINIVITSGLTEGQDVVTSGVYYVKMAGASSAIPHGHSH